MGRVLKFVSATLPCLETQVSFAETQHNHYPGGSQNDAGKTNIRSPPGGDHPPQQAFVHFRKQSVGDNRQLQAAGHGNEDTLERWVLPSSGETVCI